jgi:hypothetical protein
MKYANIKMLDASSTSTANNSTPIDASQTYSASVQAVVTGSASAGAVKLQGSNDAPYDMNSALPRSSPWVPTNWTDIASATATISGPGTLLIPVTNICHQWLRVVTTQTAAVVQTVTAVADVAGSLNSKYFLLNSSTTGYYVWLNINSAGVDPAVAGRTGIEVTAATGATAAQIATAMETAIDAVAGVFTSTPVGAVLTITNSVAGGAALASDVNTGFTFAASTFGTITARLKSNNV